MLVDKGTSFLRIYKMNVEWFYKRNEYRNMNVQPIIQKHGICKTWAMVKQRFHITKYTL